LPTHKKKKADKKIEKKKPLPVKRVKKVEPAKVPVRKSGRQRIPEPPPAATMTPAQSPHDVKRWIRGKLPGEKLIKIDSVTGKFQEIDRGEWDSLI
jgi:hypothetical protein